MRLLQLATGPDEMLDLHPNVTVVTGLDDDGHAVLVDAVVGLARAQAAAGPGLLEAHGVLFDLDPALLSVIESADADLDPIVHPAQLPTQPISVDARELRSREQAFGVLLEVIAAQAEKQSAARGVVAAAAAAVEQTRRARAEAEGDGSRGVEDRDRLIRRIEELADERRRITEELQHVGPALSSAQAARTEVERRTAAVREAVASAIALRASIEAELTELDAMRHSDAAADMERAVVALQRLEADIDAERRRDAERERDVQARVSDVEGSSPEAEPAAMRLQRLDGRLQELEVLLAVITPVEQMAVEQARALLAGGESVDLVPSLEAARLADELDQISADLSDAGAEGDDLVQEASVAEARTRLDDARQALLEAEQAVRSPELDRDDVMRLEDLHAELVEAMEKSEGRFGGARRAAERVVGLRAAEQELLDQLGFTSYSAYMMGYSLFNADPLKEKALDAAREELAAAEDAWRAIERATEAALVRAEVLDRRRGLLEQANNLLGHAVPGGRPQEALRSLRVPAVSALESATLLRASLDAVGVELGDEELDPEELALIAEAWLSEADHVDDRRRAALEELSTLHTERAGVLVEVEEASRTAVAFEPPPVVDATQEPDLEERRLERLDEARAAVAAAERRLAESAAAEVRRAGLVADLATAQEIERSAADAAGAADHEFSLALTTESELATRASALDDALLLADRELMEVQAALDELSDVTVDPAALDADLAAAEAAHAEAVIELEVVDRALATLDAEGRAAALEIERLQDIVVAQGNGSATPAEELEWYLLARLAAQRSVSVAGSVPLLLDDALRGLGADEVDHLLGRLERMAEAVQVIIVSEDPVVASWAVSAGPARAAVVRPSAR